MINELTVANLLFNNINFRIAKNFYITNFSNYPPPYNP